MHPSPPMKNSDGATDEDTPRSGHTVVAEISAESTTNYITKSYGAAELSTAAAEEDDECCPICYELFINSTSAPARTPLGDEEIEVATLSTEDAAEILGGECSCRDGDTNDDSNDGNKDDEKNVGDVNLDDERQQRWATLCFASGNLSSSFDAEDPMKANGPSRCDGSCHNQRHQRRFHPRERVKIPGCEHSFCRGCLRDYCSYALSIRELPIRCPKFSGDGAGKPCSAVLPIELAEECLSMNDAADNNDLTKFHRLQRMLEDPSQIPCTRCDELITPGNINCSNNKNDEDETNNRKSGDPNRVHCPACHHVFCRIHGDGHLGRDCSEAKSDDVDPSEKAIRELCKPCSHCGVPICKEDGCNHVVCPICKKDMCFRCGTHKDLQNIHGKNFRTCKACNHSYLDHRYLWRHRLGVMAKLPLMLPIYLGYMATALAVAVATCGCFCCLGCGLRRTRTTPSAAGQQGFSGTKPQRSIGSTKIVCMPLMALREVLRFLLLPFIDLFRDCRFPCCFCHDAPGLCKGRPANDDDDNDDEKETDVSYNEDEEEYDRTGSDVENQIKKS